MRVAPGRRRKDGRLGPVESVGRGLVPSHSSSSSSSWSAAAVQVEARSRPIEARGLGRVHGAVEMRVAPGRRRKDGRPGPVESIGRGLVPSHSSSSATPRRPVAGAEREFRPAAAWGGAAAGVAASTTPGVVWRTAPPLNKRPTSCACGGSTRALSRAGPFVTSPCASRRHRVVVDALLGEAPEKGCVVGGALPSPGLGPPTTRQEAATLLRADPHTCGVHFSRVLLSHAESVNLEVVS